MPKLGVWLAEERRAQLSALAAQTDASQASIVRVAIELYRFLSQVLRDGGQVFVETPGSPPVRVHFF